MASWIEKTLRDLALQRLQLERSNGAPQPTGPIGQPEGGGLGAAVMPQPAGPRADPGVVDEQARTLDLVENYQKYLRQSGRRADPLAGRAERLGDPAQPFRVNKNAGNKREGLSFQQYELPGGKRVNVYYGQNGERIVVHLPKRGGPAKGVSR